MRHGRQAGHGCCHPRELRHLRSQNSFKRRRALPLRGHGAALTPPVIFLELKPTRLSSATVQE